MNKLPSILRTLSAYQLKGEADRPIGKLTADSREVQQDDVFIAIRGIRSDGHGYIPVAEQSGAAVIVCEQLPQNLSETVTYIEVPDSKNAMALMADAYYDYPSQSLKIVGVTGTNGKTTTVSLLYDLFENLGFKCGLVSTVINRIHHETVAATHTTPDSIRLHELFRQMVDAGCEFAFMEVSSHAADQQRIAGVQFTGGVFTNITHDHLDYHKTFKAYIHAKKSFFDGLPKTAFALTNLDDANGQVMLQNSSARRLTYGVRRVGDYKAKILDNALAGLHLDIDGIDFFSRLVGDFNAYNLLACYAVAIELGQDRIEVLTALSQIRSAEGRMDFHYDQKNGISAIVDYAHTPDALEKVLQTLRKMRREGRIITVVGCGGDRDKDKRPVMARIATQLSEQVILTSDNPRSEDPATILREMEAGVPLEQTGKALSILDRRQAIKTACALGRKGDIILIAGKGHEKYQEINGVKTPFDDKAEVIASLEGKRV